MDPSPRWKDLAFREVCCETETSPSGLRSVHYSVLLIQLEEYWIQCESKFGVKKCPSVELLLRPLSLPAFPSLPVSPHS